MKENRNFNKKNKKNEIRIKSSKANRNLLKRLKTKEIQKKKSFTPSELILKKQNNELPLNLKMEPKIIEYLNTRDYTCFTTSKLPISKPIFEAIPPVIMFSDYEALKVKTITLKLRNRDSVARRVKIIQPETNLFKVYPKTDKTTLSPKGNKVAPGLDLCFNIKFSPERKTDYHYKLEIVTEREKFIVPIIAVGKKPLIVFPDEINFGNSCPVKYFSEKPIIIHNKGEKTSKWEIRLPKNFEANRTEGILEENSSEQLIIKFYPTERKFYKEIGTLLYDGDEAEFNLKGNAINGEVYLSKNYLQQEETYISLENRETFKIVNKSTVKIDFEWRAFSCEKEEYEKKKFLLDQLKKEEEEKRVLIYETLDLEDNMQSISNESENLEEIDEKELLLKKRKKAEMLLDRKYKAIRKALEDDTLIFEDDIFSIKPIKGSIWPKSEMSITVIFKPNAALKYLHQAYCNISCSDQRLPLYLEGEGLGPKAFLSTNSLSISDIFVNDKQLFNIYIENKGEIPAKFKLIKNNTSFSKMIQFDIEEAKLAVGQRMNIIMTFQSSKVGEFQELFKWKLEGSSEVLTLLVRGHVQAPKFEFSKKIIDFKKLSFQFEKIEHLELLNTSTVPFVFGLRIPQDGKGVQREFEIVPNNGTINPNETKKIEIKFVPHFRKIYKSVMVLDIEGIGKDMKSIPIIGESEVPTVTVKPEILDFGKIFLRYKQTREITLKNESNLYARFIVHRLNPKFESLGSIITDLDKGQIKPGSSVTINMTLTTMCIKTFEMDFVIEIVSDTNIQHFIKVKADSIGPIVELSKKTIDFGDVEVLNKYIQKITLTNRSVIDADFFAFTKSKNSIFRPVQKHYILKPNQSFDVEIVCYADDQQKFKDTLYFVIKEGVDKEVQLFARGVGSTIFCKDIKNIDFGTIYTYKTCLQEVFLENKGRRVQNLRWQRKIEKIENNNNVQDVETNVFTIYPESVCLPPKTGLMFQFKAYSTAIGNINEVYSLSSAIGTERKNSLLFTTNIQGDFIKPTLKFSKKNISFKYIWKKDQNPEIMSKNLEIISSGPLPTLFSLHIEPPFEVFPKSFSLLPNKSGIIKIDFNPIGRKSRFSNRISEKLHIKHNKHPKNETFDVLAEFCYPNLVIDCAEVNFGAVMNDTSKKTYISMKNTGIITAEYEWFFIDDGIDHKIPINEVFDILPLRGKIEPGISEKVEFSYYAVPFCSFKLTAVCKVIGGPEYFVKINAEASDVAYNVMLPKNDKFLDIGETFLDSKVTKEFELQNTSKVIFEYTVRLDPQTGNRSTFMKDFIKIYPSKGELAGGEKIKIKINVIPGFPCDIIERLILQVAHFEPERILIKGSGIFPSLRIDAERKFDSRLTSYLAKRHGLKKDLTENEWIEFFLQIKDSHIVQIEKYIIKNYIKNNFQKITTKNLTKITTPIHSSQRLIISRNTNSSKILSRSNFTRSRKDFNFMEELELSTYIIDMGTIIAGTKASKSITLKNIGHSNISYSINLHLLNIPGLSITNDKIMKLGFGKNNNTSTMTFNLNTKKTTAAGVKNYMIPIKVKDGGKYFIQIIANINVPELKLSSKLVNFSKILIGTCKTMTIRLENEKNIPCEYYIVHIKKNNKKKNSKPNRFILNKMSGFLKPFSKSNLEIKFGPERNGGYREKFLFQFKDSNRKIEFFCSGEGVIPQLEFVSNEINFEPCLPETVLFKSLEIKNHSDFDIDLILSSYDIEFIKNSQMLKFYSEDSFLKPLRKFGDRFWNEIKNEYDIFKFNEEIDKKIEVLQKKIGENNSEENEIEKRKKKKEEEEEQEIEKNEEGEEIEEEDLELKIQELEGLKKKIPEKEKEVLPIKMENQVNLLIHSCYSKLANQTSKFLSKEQKKSIVDISALLKWCIENNISKSLEIEKNLEEKLIEYENGEKERKKKKNKKLPVLSQKEFMFIDKEDFKILLTERLTHKDCKAGVILINLENDLLEINETLDIISDYYKKSNLLIIEIKEKIKKMVSNSEILENKNIVKNENKDEIVKSDIDESFEVDDLDFNQNSKEEIVSYIFSKFERKRSQFGRRSLILNAINQEIDMDEFEIDNTESKLIKKWYSKKMKSNLKNEEIIKEEEDLEDREFEEMEEKIKNKTLENFEEDLDQKIEKSQNSENLEKNIIEEKEDLKIKYFSINFPLNIIRLNYKLLEFLPTPLFPKEEDLELPESKTEQRIKKPQNMKILKNLKNFEILSYKDLYGDKIEDEGNLNLDEENYLEYLDSEKTRWNIPKKKSIFLAVKFSSNEILSLTKELLFESSVSCFNNFHKGWNLKISAKTLFPAFNTNIINIFPNRKKCRMNKKGEMFKKIYLTKEKIFFFGPLLVRDQENEDQENEDLDNKYLEQNYSSIFRFSNISPFPINVKFRIEDIKKEEEAEIVNKNEKKNSKKKNKEVEVEEEIFKLDLNQEENILQIDETLDLKVWAIPNKIGEFNKNLICEIENNPEPFIIPLNCISTIPSLNIKQEFLDFDKLIINKSLSKNFKIENNSLIPVKWKIINLEELKESNFEIFPTEGNLKIKESKNVDIIFKALKSEKISKEIIIEVEDSENQGIKGKETYHINLNAEGFEILVDFEGFSDCEKMIIDFGQTLVNKSVEKNFVIKNTGLYSIDFELLFFKKKISDFFIIEPSVFELESNCEKEIKITFIAQKEIVIKPTDKKCFLTIRILEKKSKDIFNEIKVHINSLAQFSKFNINPLKQLNFGPIIFSEIRKRIFEIKNTGLFEFNFDLFDYEKKEIHEEILEKYKNILNGEDSLKKKEKNSKKKDNQILNLDLYSITPSNGTLKSGESIKIEVTFKGKDNNWHEKKLGIELLNRNRQEDKNGLIYMLVGESCVPSIETKRFQNIFEEQIVTQSLNSTGLNIQNVVQGNVFSIDDNTFYFGNIIPSKYPKGISEKFKLINNGKVNVNLNCDVKSKGNSNFAFSIFPKTITISPHEYVYVKINFKPEIMSVYEGTFEAVVMHDNKNLDCKFEFDLKGEGILPTLKVLERNEIIDFGKIRSDRIKIKKVVVKNIGLIPATAVCRIDSKNRNFRLISPPERTIMPQENYPFEIQFKPGEKGVFENFIEFETILNKFEKSKFKIKGQGFFEVVSFDGLEEEEDILNFGDMILKPEITKLGKKTFFLKNHSTSIIRFNWKELPPQFNWISISPNIGHIGPNMKKKIIVRINRAQSDKSILLNLKAVLEIELIQLTISLNLMKQRQWDNSKKSKRIVTKTEFEYNKNCEELLKNYKEEFKKNKKAKKPKMPEMPIIDDSEEKNMEINEFVKEPEYKLIKNEKKEIELLITGKIDIPNFSCDIEEIFFKKTKMFCSRTYNIKIKNLSLIKLKYFWEFYDEFSGTNDSGYFSINQNKGVIDKEDTKEFILRFNPTECDKINSKRLLFFKIKGTTLEHKIDVYGDTERPICHFELPFVKSENLEKVIEMQSLGYNNSNIKKFYILNPTALSYDFCWEFNHTTNSYLKCLTPKGTILSGKKFETRFEFLPNKNCPDMYKKNFTFLIPSHKIRHNFLFKAKVLQPKIFFSKAKIDFGPLLLKAKGKEIIKIKNLDNVPYRFNFQKSSIKGPFQSHYNSLIVSPISGAIAPQSEIPISINLLPKLETNYNYNLICNITSKKEPLTLNIKGIGYKLHHSVFVKDKLISSHFKQIMNFGEIFVNENLEKNFCLINNGDFNFDFVILRKHNSSLKIEPENGTIHKNEKIKIKVLFEPKSETKLKMVFKLKIISGPTYKFEVKGTAMFPQLEIKSSLVNFGSVLVTNNPLIMKKEIKFINHDKKTLTLDTNFIKNDYLKIKLAPSQSVLPYKNNKKNIISVPIFLNLRKLGKFSEKIEFVINNNHKLYITVKGEGVPLNIELEKPQNINLDMGELRPFQKISKEIKIFNNSKVPVYMNFDYEDQLSKFFGMNIGISPKTLFIGQRSSAILDIVFTPQSRVRNFSIPLFYSLKESGQNFELLSIKGACYDVEIKLMEDLIDFGDVVVNSSLTKKFNLVNLGDINAEFKWDLGFMGGYFSIIPEQGLINSNQRKTFECTFMPKSLNKYNLICKLFVKNSDDVIKLKLFGKGTDTHPDSIQNINFECPVRETITKTVEIKNNTLTKWSITPNLTFEKNVKGFFKVEDTIEIPSKTTKNLEIIYKPLTINPEIQKATLFLPLKDGNAILHNLIGKALPPNPEKTIKLKFKAKQNFYYTMQIKNWLSKQQRLDSSFTVKNSEIPIKKENKQNSLKKESSINSEDKLNPIEKGIIVNAAEIIDLSSGGVQNYKIGFSCLKEGRFEIKAVFKNLKTREFIFYVFELEVEESEVLREIEISSSVRESVSKIILIDNPLGKEVVIMENDLVLDSESVFVKSQFPLVLKPNLDFGLELIFRPLIEFEKKEVSLKIKTEDLGIFKYKLILQSKKNNNIPTLYFKSKIGDTCTKTFTFKNYLKTNTQYQIKIEKLSKNDSITKDPSDFQVQSPTITAKQAQSFEGIQNTLELKYEPSIIGVSKAFLQVTNKEGGNFNAYLIGQSSMPLPKGPFKINLKGRTIEFKNPFFESREFFVKSDNKCFVVSAKQVLKLDSKKTCNLGVSFKPQSGVAFEGRLVVESGGISWVFYLQGVNSK